MLGDAEWLAVPIRRAGPNVHGEHSLSVLFSREAQSLVGVVREPKLASAVAVELHLHAKPTDLGALFRSRQNLS